MIECNISLASTGSARTSGCDNQLRLGYSKNRGIYRLNITQTGEWEGMTIRALWHTERGMLFSSLVEEGKIEVPAIVTSMPGCGRLVFEGSDGTRTLTSADIKYSVAMNSGTMGDIPEPPVPAWQQLVALVEQAKDEAWQAGEDARQSAAKANEAYENTIGAKDSAVTEIRKAETDALNNVEAAAGPAASAAADAAAAGAKEKAEKAIQEVKDNAVKEVKEAAAGAAVRAAQSATDAASSASAAASSAAAAKNAQTAAEAAASNAQSIVSVDSTLKVAGAPADAKATGDALAGKAAASHTHGNMAAATASAAGKAGFVPAPAAGAQAKYLRGDGTWQTPPTTNTTYGAATQSAPGLMSAADKKKLDGVAAGANAYSLPTATASVLGGVKTGSNITNSSGTISLTKANVTAALGYTPPTSNTWRGVQDNLTSTATNQSLSANQGKVLKGLVDGKAATSHTHNYAGSGSAGGTANSVNGLTFAAQTTDPGAGSSLATNKVLIVYV